MKTGAVSMLLALATLSPGTAGAVSCGGSRTLGHAFAEADHVFLAHVQALRQDKAFGLDDATLAEMKVVHVWKGAPKPGDVVDTSAQDSVRFVSDGVVPMPDTDMLVFASGSPPYFLSACSRSGPAEGRMGEVRALDRLSHGSD